MRNTDGSQPEPAAAARLESWRPALQNLDEMDLARPWSDRLIKPFWRRIQNVGQRITPQNRVAALQKT